MKCPTASRCSSGTCGPRTRRCGIRSRAVALDDWCIADGAGADDAFVHVTVKIGAGRSDALKKRVFDALFDKIAAHLAPAFDARGFALSMEVAEFSEAGSWQQNILHAPYRK